MEVVLDGISPSSFLATSWSFPAMNVWVEVIYPSYREGDVMRQRCPNQRRRRCRRRDEFMRLVAFKSGGDR